MHNSVLAVISQKLKMAETHDRHKGQRTVSVAETNGKQTSERNEIIAANILSYQKCWQQLRKLFDHNKRPKFLGDVYCFWPRSPLYFA